MFRSVALILPALAITVGPIAAQTPTVPVRLGQCPLERSDTATTLTSKYESGDWNGFQKYAKDLLASIRLSCDPNRITNVQIQKTVESINPDVDYVILAWVGKNQFAERTLYSAILHRKASPYASTLPGVAMGSGRLFQIFISPLEIDALASVYVSIRERNPLEAQLPSVIESIVNPLFAALAQQQGDLRAARIVKPPPRVYGSWATIWSVSLPFRRANIAVEMRASVFSSSDAFAQAGKTLAETLKFMNVSHSECAMKLADDLAEILEQKKACATETNGCADDVGDDFKSKYGERRNECHKDDPGAKVDSAAVDEVDRAFRKLVAEQEARDVTTKLSLRNVPPERYSFGLLTGYSYWGKTTSPRAIVDDGQIVAAPLERPLAMVIVNVAFRRYDPTLFSPSKWERYRGFAGVVVTPDIGVGGGFSALLVRGLAINIGGFVVASPSAPEDAIGSPPQSAQDPLGSTVGAGLFVGASYNFK